jgi:hypothetical protein
MAIQSSHIGFASCCICALITGFAFLLEGCGNDDTDIGGSDGTKCEFNLQEFKEKGESCKCKYNLDEFKENQADCFNNIEGGDSCAGVEEKLATCYGDAPRRGWQVHHPEYDKAAYGKCDVSWVDEIVDPKFPDAKKRFQDSVEPCLKELKIAHDCSPEYKAARWHMYDGCWQIAEVAAGGKWEQKLVNGQNATITDCPTDWMWESVIRTQKDWVDWYKATCVKK